MKKSKNTLVLTTFILLSSVALLPVAPVSNAQQLNHIKAYIMPVETQKSYFPSEQQVQEALASRSSVAKQKFLFPPLENPPLKKQPQEFINQFSTPDAPRTTSMSQFVTPNLMLDNETVPQRYNMPDENGYAPLAMNFPTMPCLARKPNNNFPSQGFANNFESKNNGNLFSFPNFDLFSAMPFANMNALPSIIAGNKIGNSFPLMPKTTNSRGKKMWGQTISTPQKLGHMFGGWHFPYVSTPNSMAVSDTVVNQFPPVADEAGNMSNISK
jgi:hypothetical protein